MPLEPLVFIGSHTAGGICLFDKERSPRAGPVSVIQFRFCVQCGNAPTRLSLSLRLVAKQIPCRSFTAIGASHLSIGKSTFDLGFSFASDFQRNLEKVIADQFTYRGKFVHTFASGQGERFEYTLAPVLDEQRNTEAIACISRDITEQALAEEKIWHNAQCFYDTTDKTGRYSV